jgi:hypothetical protein
VVDAEANKRLKMKSEVERFIFLYGRRHCADYYCRHRYSSVVNYRRLYLSCRCYCD